MCRKLIRRDSNCYQMAIPLKERGTYMLAKSHHQTTKLASYPLSILSFFASCDHQPISRLLCFINFLFSPTIFNPIQHFRHFFRSAHKPLTHQTMGLRRYISIE